MSVILPTIDEFAESARERINNFNDPSQEWRRLVAEFVGTFFLVTAAAGGSMVDTLYPGTVSPGMKAAAIGLTIMAVILFLGKVSGSHLNPAITIAFAARGDFPWRRVPGYIIVQTAAGFAAAFVLTALVGVSSSNGGSYPGAETSPLAAMFVEMLLTFGLASVVLGTASGAQSVGMFAALGVGGYIAAAAMWGAPLSGSSMDPARSIGPNIIGGAPGPLWVYIIGPIAGGLIAVVLAYLLRGHGGHLAASQVAQGALGRGAGGTGDSKTAGTPNTSPAQNSDG
jgi:aquaporin Z